MFQPTHRIAQVLADLEPGQEIRVSGWVRTRRDSKNDVTFIELNDGSCMSNLQLVVDRTTDSATQMLEGIGTGASLTAAGTLAESPGSKQRVELHNPVITLLGIAPAEEYPLQKKRHSFEFLREIAHLRPRTNTFGAITRVRNAASFAVHEFFQSRDFHYIQTPIITTSDCEGAGQMFQVSTLDFDRLQKSTKPLDYKFDFFGKPAHLTVSGQLEAEIFATATGPCYTFGPTFRAENSNTTRHLAEFWMIEPEMPFCDLNDNMQVAEEFVKHVIDRVMTRCAEDIDFFNLRIDKTVTETLKHVLEQPFRRVAYTEAIEILEACDQKFEYPVEWGCDLQSEHERYLTEQHFKQPVILYDYPRTIKPFYMRCNDDGKTVRAMDILVPRVGELIGGSQREERLDVLKQRMEECQLSEEDYWWYLDLRRFGSVPHSGFGLGFERLILFLTGMQNIRDCIPFPRTPKNADF